MTINLSGPRAKIERAYEHRNALESELVPVLSGERHQIQLSAKLDPDTGNHVFRVASMPESFRRRVAVIVGDLVHNLRSALDQLAWQLVLDYSGRPTKRGEIKRIKFPIETDSQRLTRTHTFNKVSPSDQTLLDRAQPYNGLDDPKLHGLTILEELSNRDKHQTLNPSLVVTNRGGVPDTQTNVAGFDIFRFWFTGAGESLEIGTEVFQTRIVGTVDAEVEVAGHATPDIRLPQRPDFPLINGLDVVIGSTQQTVAAFAAAHGV